MEKITIKRIYDEPSDEDGYRVLVDRLWPRGISKKEAKLDEWDKEIAPSPELRKWFDHRKERFEEFGRLYREEPKAKSEDLHRLKKLGEREAVTLLYGAKDPEINHAVILKDLLLQ